jgi:hypothetical protein
VSSASGGDGMRDRTSWQFTTVPLTHILSTRLRDGQGERATWIDPSLAAGIVDGLDHLEYCPHECTGQAIGRFLPNVPMYRALQSLDLTRSTITIPVAPVRPSPWNTLNPRPHEDGSLSARRSTEAARSA